jgi:hypothetical protein
VKPFTLVAVVVFALVAVLQLVRFLMGWEVTIDGMSVPPWASAIAAVIAARLAVMLGREARQGVPR